MAAAVLMLHITPCVTVAAAAAHMLQMLRMLMDILLLLLMPLLCKRIIWAVATSFKLQQPGLVLTLALLLLCV